MSLEEVKNEVSKGLKTYKVFKYLDEAIDEIENEKRNIREKKDVVDKLEKKIALLSEQKAKLDATISASEASAEKIIAAAKLEADSIKKSAKKKASEEEEKAKNKLSSVLDNIKQAENTLTETRKEVAVLFATKDAIQIEIEAAKDKFRKML